MTPNWLDADMAEQLRHSVEARLLLEAEEQQVCCTNNLLHISTLASGVICSHSGYH
jgi:hypothetical protein